MRDFEHRVSAPTPEMSPSPSLGSVPGVQQSMEEVRSRVTKMLSSTAIQSKSSQISGLFKKK